MHEREVDVALRVWGKVRGETRDCVEFAGAIKGGEGREATEEYADIGDWDEEGKPVHGEGE